MAGPSRSLIWWVRQMMSCLPRMILRICRNRDQDRSKEWKHMRGPSKTFGLGQQSHRKPCASKHSRIEKQVLSKNSRPDFWVFWAPNCSPQLIVYPCPAISTLSTKWTSLMQHSGFTKIKNCARPKIPGQCWLETPEWWPIRIRIVSRKRAAAATLGIFCI